MQTYRNILLTLCLGFLCLGNLHAQWTQVGTDIDGKTDGDKLGSSISYSSDGTKLAIGSPNSAGGGLKRGQVTIYQIIKGEWTQIGQNIVGESDFDQSGWSVSMSSDGTKVAIGSIFNLDNSGRGHVRIFQLRDSTWTQIGEDIEGENDGDNSGASISLSSDGRKVAIGAPKNLGGGFQRGHVRVYQYDGRDWVQLGEDIEGKVDNDNIGSAVFMSADGSKVAIGVPSNDGGGTQRGLVRIFQFKDKTWTQLGENIQGEADDDNAGNSLSMSFDGTKIAIGATGNDGGGYNSGHVRVFQYTGSTWKQLGASINGQASKYQSGSSVSLSEDGKRLAVGARLDAGGGYNRGSVRVFEYNGTTWIPLSTVINGESDGDLSGSAVSLSADGASVAIGAPSNGGDGGQQRGHVRIFQTYLPPSVKEVVQTTNVKEESGDVAFPTEVKIQTDKEPTPIVTAKSVAPVETTPTPVEKAVIPLKTTIATEKIPPTASETVASNADIDVDKRILPTFTGRTEGGKNKLNWTARIETTTKGFYVDRKTEEDWESLGYISAYYNVKAYQFEDNLPRDEVNTYRVRTLYKNGDVTYSETISVDNNWKLRDVKLYPNQATSTVNIENNGQIIHTIIVTNSMGQVVLTKIRSGGADEPQGLRALDIQGLANGVYLVHIMSGSKIVTQKLLKE